MTYEVDPKSGLKFRTGTEDLMVIAEQPAYEKYLQLRNDDVLLDLGANIGAFAALYAPKVRRVVCFEPEPDNYALLMDNTFGHDNVISFQKAVMDNMAPPYIPFWINSKRNKGSHTTVETRGRQPIEVPTEPLSVVYHTWRPTVVKCDIEGAEYRTLLTTDTPSYVREIVMELHLTKKNWRSELAPRLIEKLSREGFATVRVPTITDRNWHTIGAFRRQDQ